MGHGSWVSCSHALVPTPNTLDPVIVTGYSLGFYSALVAGGAMDFVTGLAIVKEAAKLMEVGDRHQKRRDDCNNRGFLMMMLRQSVMKQEKKAMSG